MTSAKSFKERVSRINKYWQESSYDRAFAKADDLRSEHPDNPQALVMWASLLQLLDESEYSLDDAKKALRQAMDFDDASPVPAIELGHFLDAIEDDPKAASHTFMRAISQARNLLVEALIGNAKCLLQLNRRSDAIRCLLDALQVSKTGTINRNGSSKPKIDSAASDIEGLIEAMLAEPLRKTG